MSTTPSDSSSTRSGPALLILPALGVAPGYYRPLVDALATGLDAEAALLPPLRPARLREWLLPPRGRYGYAHLVQSTLDAGRRLRRQHAGRPLVLLGHSLGGQVGLLAAAAADTPFDGIALIASGTPCWRAWPAAMQHRMRAAVTTVDVASACLPWYPGRLLGFGGNQPRPLMRDWAVTARSGRYAGVAAGEGFDAALQSLTLPVLALAIEGDAFAPQPAVEWLLALTPRAAVTRAVARSEQLAKLPPPRRHVAWVREPQAVLPHLAAWLRTAALVPERRRSNAGPIPAGAR